MGNIHALRKYLSRNTEAKIDYDYIKRFLCGFSGEELVEVFLHFNKKVRSLAGERLRKLLENPFFKEREKVFSQLVLANTKRVEIFFINMLAHKEEHMRLTALRLLNNFSTKKVDRVFIRTAKNQKDVHLRKLSIYLMATRQRKRIESVLISLLRDKDFVVRALAIEALAGFQSVRVSRSLLCVVFHDEIDALQFSAFNVAMNNVAMTSDDIIGMLMEVIDSSACKEAKHLARNYLLSHKIAVEDSVYFKNPLTEDNSSFVRILASG